MSSCEPLALRWRSNYLFPSPWFVACVAGFQRAPARTGTSNRRFGPTVRAGDAWLCLPYNKPSCPPVLKLNTFDMNHPAAVGRVHRCRVNMAHTRRLRLDPGLGVQEKSLESFSAFPLPPEVAVANPCPGATTHTTRLLVILLRFSPFCSDAILQIQLRDEDLPGESCQGPCNGAAHQRSHTQPQPLHPTF